MLEKPLHGGNVYRASRELNIAIDKILDFSANINPLGYPPKVEELIKNHIKDIIHYPDIEQRQLKKSASTYYGTTEDRILPGNGSVELINIVIEALKPSKAIIPSPTFAEYSLSCESRKVPVKYVELSGDNFIFDEVILEKIKKLLIKNSLLVLCNPNNPTGNVIKPKIIKKVLDVLKSRQSYLLLDEAFMDFVEADESMVSFLEKYDNLLILKSVTKFFALPGLRLGFLLANPNLIENFKKFKDPWNINTFAGIVGTKVIGEKHYIQKTRELIFTEKEWLWKQLKQIPGFKPIYPEANFIFVKIEQGITTTRLAQGLRKQGILIRDCSNYTYLDDTFFRVAVKNREENQILVSKIKDILCEKGCI